MKQWSIAIAASMGIVCSAQTAAANELDIHPYIGVAVSSISMDLGQINGGGFSGFGKQSATGFTIKGGVDLHRYFGIEVRGLFSGSASSSGSYLGIPVNVSAKINNGTAYFAKLQYPFDNHVRIYALGGGSNASTTATLTAFGSSLSASGSGSSGSYGGGLAYDTEKSFSAEIEWVRYAADANAASLFVSYSF